MSEDSLGDKVSSPYGTDNPWLFPKRLADPEARIIQSQHIGQDDEGIVLTFKHGGRDLCLKVENSHLFSLFHHPSRMMYLSQRLKTPRGVSLYQPENRKMIWPYIRECRLPERSRFE